MGRLVVHSCECQVDCSSWRVEYADDRWTHVMPNSLFDPFARDAIGRYVIQDWSPRIVPGFRIGTLKWFS
jgi:hypothetical protein